ncbi:hypothetical protein EVAR_50596_1 [Eumeta japonica]|uniref:Uncharacterized protein n=1 Tax=Eumeta variegata TaxID=151549 RepID=A0A4C1Y6L8_EUMVA|nr:hypothetical protein EVAR_50596_1 [Eumeta japonica]
MESGSSDINTSFNPTRSKRTAQNPRKHSAKALLSTDKSVSVVDVSRGSGVGGSGKGAFLQGVTSWYRSRHSLQTTRDAPSATRRENKHATADPHTLGGAASGAT